MIWSDVNILREKLEEVDGIFNIRNCGLLFAFDFDSNEKRNQFQKNLFELGMLTNSSRNRTIRLRPNLAVTRDEINTAIQKINSAITFHD